MDFISENVIKCLKQEIDSYREKYAIALQEIKELNYFSKEDNDKLKAEVKRLKGVLDMDSSLDDAIIKDAELIRELKAENKRLNRVNAELSDKLQAVNDDYNNDTKVHNEYADGLLAEIKAEKLLNTANRQTITKLKNDYEELLIDKKKYAKSLHDNI